MVATRPQIPQRRAAFGAGLSSSLSFRGYVGKTPPPSAVCRGRLERGKNLFQEEPVGARAVGHFLERLAAGALDESRAVESGLFQLCVHADKIHLARAELDHDIALGLRAILGTHAGDV